MSSNKFIQLSDWHECYVVFNEKFCMIQCNYPLPPSLVYSSDLIWTWQFNNRWWNLHSFNFHGLKPLVCFFFQNKNSTYIYVIKFIQCFWRRSKKCKKKIIRQWKQRTNKYILAIDAGQYVDWKPYLSFKSMWAKNTTICVRIFKKGWKNISYCNYNETYQYLLWQHSIHGTPWPVL